MQNFLVFPCYLAYFISHIPALSHFVFFNFYYIITERFYLRILSFYFKIYYLIKHLQKSPISKTEQTSPARFFHPPKKPNVYSYHFRKPNVNSHHFRLFRKTHHPKQCVKKRSLHETSSLIFVFNLTVQSTYSTRDSQSSHPHRLV